MFQKPCLISNLFHKRFGRLFLDINRKFPNKHPFWFSLKIQEESPQGFHLCSHVQLLIGVDEHHSVVSLVALLSRV